MPATHSKPVYDQHRSAFIELAARRTARQVKAETGLSPDTLDFL